MKAAKIFVALFVLVGSFTTNADAVVVHITGSTVFRAQMNRAIIKSFDPGTHVKIGVTNTNLDNSAVSYFRGTMNTIDTIIETKMTLSVDGVKAVCNNLDTVPGAVQEISDPQSPVPNFTSGNGLSPIPSGQNTVAAEVTMSDTYQSTTLYRSPPLARAVINGGQNRTGIVGVAPLVWVRTPCDAAPVAAFTNMTANAVSLLYGNGTLPLAFFTHQATDESFLIYAAGRMPDSGVRLNAFAECGLGANATVVQYHPAAQTFGASYPLSLTGMITDVEVFPDTLSTGLGRVFVDGNAGESSGGNLAAYMSKVFNTGTPGALVTYFSIADATNAIRNGAVPLTWNGVAIVASPSSLGSSPVFDFSVVRNGQYTFWAYEQMLYNRSADPTKKTVADKIATQIFNEDADSSSTGIRVKSMRVSRQVDAGIIGPVY